MLMPLLWRRSAETTVRLSSHPIIKVRLITLWTKLKKKNLCYFAAPLAQKAQQFHHLPPPVQAQLVAVFMFSATLGCKCWNGLDGSHVEHFRELWKLPWEAAGVKSAVDGGSSLLFTSKHYRFFFSGRVTSWCFEIHPEKKKKKKLQKWLRPALVCITGWIISESKWNQEVTNNQDENNNHNKMCPHS